MAVRRWSPWKLWFKKIIVRKREHKLCFCFIIGCLLDTNLNNNNIIKIIKK